MRRNLLLLVFALLAGCSKDAGGPDGMSMSKMQRQIVVGLSFSVDGHWLATAGEDNHIRLWRLSELQDRRQGHDKASARKR